MALTIFDTDPDAKPKERVKYTDDTVGRFFSGHQVESDKGKMVPESLDTWLVRTGDPVVAAAIAQLLKGSEPTEDTTSGSENFISVYTTAESVPIILADAEALYSDMKQWNNGKLVHHCNGSTFLSHQSRDELIGTDCGCPPLFEDRKQNAIDEIGPKPSITITFRLADDPELGLFKFQTGAWTMAKVLHEYENALTIVDGEAIADLTLELVSYVAKKGKMKGKRVEYTKPVLENIRSYNAAIGE